MRLTTILLGIMLAGFCLLTCPVNAEEAVPPAAEAVAPPPPPAPETPEDKAKKIVAEAISLVKVYAESPKKNLFGASKLLDEAEKLQPKDKKVLFDLYYWKSFINCRISSQNIVKGAAAQMKKYKIAEKYADKMIKINPKSAEGYMWKGNSIALWADTKGVLNALFAVPDVKKNYKKCIRLDPKHPVCLTSMGAVYQALPWVAGGSTSKAMDFYDKALKLNGKYSWTYLKKAKLLVADDEYKDARELLQKGLKLTAKNEYWPWDYIAYERNNLKNLLKEIKNK